MKTCPNCHKHLSQKPTPFCPECGKPLWRKRPKDTGYDGYYNDVLPIDAETRREGLDPAMMKRIAIVIVGAVVVIIMASLLMTLL